MSAAAEARPAMNITNDPKDKMSRALGAAFLGHQVEKLENRVNQDGSPSSKFRGGRGRGRGGGRVWVPDQGTRPRKRSFSLHPAPSDAAPEQPQPAPAPLMASPVIIPGKDKSNMANVIILDASVLVYALSQVKRWCKEERKEILIVPLEVLNTLDLLKKGTSPLAIHARAASRFLEAQVGLNPRIQVQRDEEFLPWDTIYSNAASSQSSLAAESALPAEDRAPEWMRQIVCCTVWEMNQPTIRQVNNARGDRTQLLAPRVALAVVKPLTNNLLETPTGDGPGMSSAETAGEDLLYQSTYARHALRASGELIRHWGPRLGIKVLQIEQSVHEHTHPGSPHARGGMSGMESRTSPSAPGGRRGGGGNNHHHRRGRSSDDPNTSSSRGPMVEKTRNGVDPRSVVVAPNTSPAMVAPGVNKIRLLTRGEKLEP